MKAYVYILQDNNDRFYVGSTINMAKRMRQHELGHTQTTKNMSYPKLVLQQEVTSLLIARRVENKLKKMRRKDYIGKIVADGYIRITE